MADQPQNITIQPAPPAPPSVWGQIVVGALAGVLAWFVIDALQTLADDE